MKLKLTFLLTAALCATTQVAAADKLLILSAAIAGGVTGHYIVKPLLKDNYAIDSLVWSLSGRGLQTIMLRDPNGQTNDAEIYARRTLLIKDIAITTSCALVGALLMKNALS